MRIRTTFTHPHPAVGTTTDAHLVISLHGEEFDGPRPRIAVIPVVDRSGSMGSHNKLNLVTAALRHLSTYLTEADRVALVSFDTVPSTHLPVTAGDAAGAQAFNAALGQLSPRGGTDISAGLRTALAAARRTSADMLTRLVVLTDGQANAGARTLAEFAPLLADRPEHVSISFLGVGADCDHNLLGQLAEAGGGSYGFIETATDAPGVLGAEIGSLLGAEAHQVNVTVTTRDRYATLTSDAPLGMPGTRAENTMTFTVAQVLTGVTRNIVIPVTLTGTGKAHARPVTCAEVHLTARRGEEPFEFTGRPKVKFTDPAGPVDDEVRKIVELALVAQTVEDARALADAGRYDAARGLFTSLDLIDPAAVTMRNSMLSRYANQTVYASSAADLSSMGALTRGSLAGSSRAFDALAMNTLGSYYSADQVSVAAATSVATGTVKSGTTTAPEGHDPDAGTPAGSEGGESA